MINLALERIANAFERIATSLEKLAEGMFPVKQLGREAVVTHIPTEEDIAKQEQGYSEEPIEEWIGLREKEFVEKTAKAENASGRDQEREEMASDDTSAPWD